MKKNLKSKKIALYNPYLDTLGGGEKHILSILRVFAEKGAKINIFWDQDLTQKIKDRFGFSFIEKVNWLKTSLLKTSFRTLFFLKNFDYFFYVTDGSYFFSSAKKNFIFSMIPDKKLYQLNFLNKLKLLNYQFISNSTYTNLWLKKWGIKSIVITPYIDDQFFKNNYLKKEKIILSVGRFFPHLHSKNQEKIILTFLKLKKTSQLFKDYRLILVGGLKKEDKKYFYKLKELAKNDQSIIFKPNVSFFELDKLYKAATYFWHFTGLHVDEKKNPEKTEHFGIAPLEAMARKNIVFCHNSGGPKLIIENNQTGFLFNNEKDLIEKIKNLEKNQKLKEKIGHQAFIFVKKRYNYQLFKKKMEKLI